MAFVNPYNFIPMESAPAIAAAESGEKKYTGVIDYSLLTKTPLFIPNTSNDHYFKDFDAYRNDPKTDHKSYTFFTYDDVEKESFYMDNPSELPNRPPVIPGSEMRGMLRSNYEILTNSCMSAVDDDKLMSKRTQEKYKPGLIKCLGKDRFAIYKAMDYLVRTKGANNLEPDTREIWDLPEGYTRQCYIQDSLSEGQKVSFAIVPRKDNPRGAKPLAKIPGDELTGYVMKGEAGPEIKAKQNKHCLHIFSDTNQKAFNYDLSREGLEGRLVALLDMYKGNEVNEYKEYRRELLAFMDKAAVNSCFPVYYSILFNDILLSSACITRELYQNTLSDLIGPYKSCEKKSNRKCLCPACSLFGTFFTDREDAVTTRIRVTDLQCDRTNEDWYDKPKTLDILSAPKFAPEYYLKKPDVNAYFWTYAYFVSYECVNGKIQTVLHPNNAGVNGRKFYWHNMAVNDEKKSETPAITNQNKTIRPVRKGVRFSGQVYFQDITEKELNTLIYLINAGDNDSLEAKKHGYKLGGAKPLGLGSVAMKVDRVVFKNCSMDDKNESIVRSVTDYVEKDNAENLVAGSSEANFKKMTDFYAVTKADGEISYPYADKDNKENIYSWFVSNHTGFTGRKYDRYSSEKYVDKSDMPAERRFMMYKQYLEAMKPVASNTDINKMYNQPFNTNAGIDTIGAPEPRGIYRAGTEGSRSNQTAHVSETNSGIKSVQANNNVTTQGKGKTYRANTPVTATILGYIANGHGVKCLMDDGVSIVCASGGRDFKNNPRTQIGMKISGILTYYDKERGQWKMKPY